MRSARASSSLATTRSVSVHDDAGLLRDSAHGVDGRLPRRAGRRRQHFDLDTVHAHSLLLTRIRLPSAPAIDFGQLTSFSDMAILLLVIRVT